MNFQEVNCKSILSESDLYGIDYSINPYTGCQHACKYCYAVYMKKFTEHEEKWGKFVDAKVNADEVLKKEIKKKKSGSTLISSVTDPYQPIEKECKITRKIIDILQGSDFSVSILTKSDLVLRDLKILKKFSPGKLSVGFTINFLKDRDRKLWETRASSINSRLEALKKLHNEGIPTYVHVGPYLEGIGKLEEIFDKVKDYIYEFQVENLNSKRKEKIRSTIKKEYPNLEERYRSILNGGNEYRKRLKGKVENIRKRSKIPVRLFLD